MTNPWLETKDQDQQDAVEPSAAGSDVAPGPPEARLAAMAQPGITLPAAEQRFPIRRVPTDTATVWLVGAHGGAGESTLTELVAGSASAAHAWPIPAEDERAPRVLLLARTNAHGLQAAQRALSEWAAGGLPIDLLGLALVADAPGRLPKALRELCELVAGGAPRVWQLPWVDGWRLGDPVSLDSAPRAVRSFVNDVGGLTDADTTITR